MTGRTGNVECKRVLIFFLLHNKTFNSLAAAVAGVITRNCKIRWVFLKMCNSFWA